MMENASKTLVEIVADLAKTYPYDDGGDCTLCGGGVDPEKKHWDKCPFKRAQDFAAASDLTINARRP